MAVLGRLNGFSGSGTFGSGGVDSNTLEPLLEADVLPFRPPNSPPTTPRPTPDESRSGLDVGLADFLEDPVLKTSLKRPAGDRDRTVLFFLELGARLSDSAWIAATGVGSSTGLIAIGGTALVSTD